MAFCDFCTCKTCQNGTEGLTHARTKGDRWICDVCWTYDLCTSDKNPYGTPRNKDGPCPSDKACAHRPLLSTGKWTTLEQDRCASPS